MPQKKATLLSTPMMVLAAFLIAAGSAIASSSDTGGDAAMSRVSRTALVAIAAANDSDGVSVVRGGLALLDTWLVGNYAGQDKAPQKSSQATESEAPQGQPDGETGAIPPASAGTNGSPYDHPTAAGSRVIVAHSLASVAGEEGGPITTLVSGVALAPPSAPEPIKRAINSANMISRTPYVWGGGHQSWYSNGYDCSGAVSFALYGAGMLSEPLASGQLASWGAPGEGRWLTVYANAGHAYAVIAGLRWDTVGDARGSGPRWHPNRVPPAGFVARHYPGF
jgi:hypothetical protein